MLNKFQGRDSSDGEELDGAPDDDEYDTGDSFIDDVELVSIDNRSYCFFFLFFFLCDRSVS